MKVCFVSKEVAGLRGGGIGTYIAEAGKALRAHGHEAWLLTTVYDAADTARLPALPFDRVVVAGEGVPAKRRRNLFHAMPHYGYSYLVHQTLLALGEKFDYIEFPDYEAEGLIPLQEQRLFGAYGSTVLGVMLHSPTWECFAYDGQGHRANLHIRETCNIEEEAIRVAPMLNSPSQGLRDEVLRRLGIERDVAIIRYPMEFGDAVAPSAPRRTSAPQDIGELAILYYGRIEPRKGIEELVTAFRELPECKITLIGGDVPYSPYGTSFRDHLQRRAPANVEFRGPMARPELLALVQRADVCIFPSRFENWPNTCIEAMAAGCVVIGSHHGGMSEMIEHGVSGFHVDGRSSADIVRVFREDLSSSLSRLDEIGAAAVARIRAFSEQRRYCAALQARVESFAAAMLPLTPIDHESHRVSVIVPFYKDRDTVDATVDSACEQTHRNLEIVLVNDGSPLPDAADILSRQAAKDTRIRVLHKANGGLGSARNYGIEHATGEFVLFCDADNILRSDYARTGVEVLVRHADSHFVTPHARFFEDGTNNEIGVYNALPFDRNAGLLINRFGDAGAFFRRSLFVDHGVRYDEVLISYEDWALWMDLAHRGIAGERVPRELYDYRVRADSMMRVDGLPNHPALMGWLIQHHFPRATQAERDILTTVFQVAGQSIARVTFGHPDHVPDQRPEALVPLRHTFVDEVSRLSGKSPGLNRILRALLGGVVQVGRYARRRAARP